MTTSIQLSEDLRKRLKVLSSHRDLPYEEILKDLIKVFEKSIPFNSERDFGSWFEKNFNKLGFKKIAERKQFPDYIVLTKDGKKIGVELELIADDFTRHGHDPKKVDKIVCVWSDKKEIDDVPVLSIVDASQNQEDVIQRLHGNYSTVSIPVPLFKKLKKWIKNTGFTSVSSFVEYVIREVVSEKKEGDEPFTEEDEKRVKERLRALGYI